MHCVPHSPPSPNRNSLGGIDADGDAQIILAKKQAERSGVTLKKDDFYREHIAQSIALVEGFTREEIRLGTHLICRVPPV